MTSLAYIDEAIAAAVDHEDANPTIKPEDRTHASAAGRMIVAGLRIYDEDMERGILDGIIAKRRESIAMFRASADALRSKLAERDVTPLAMVPTAAWRQLCAGAGLFSFLPDELGRVAYTREGFPALADMHAHRIDAYAKENWPAFLLMMFPTRYGPRPMDRTYYYSTPIAQLQLPDPPADVAAILRKARFMVLTVAAEPAAIGFAQTPAQIVNRSRQLAADARYSDAWARRRGYNDMADWVARCPIISTDHGNATAIIAQFGNFPIEKALVDATIKANSLFDMPGREAVQSVMMTARGQTVEGAYLDEISARLPTLRGLVHPEAPLAFQSPPAVSFDEVVAPLDRFRQALADLPILFDPSRWTGRNN